MEFKNFNMNFFSLEGKVAMVTGANQGIGQALAYGLAAAGADLYIATYDDKWEETR